MSEEGIEGKRERHDKNIKRQKARRTMRAKLVTDGIEDVGLMVTTAARFRRGSFSIATWVQRVRGETWPKVILQLFFFSIFCSLVLLPICSRERGGEGGKVQRDYCSKPPKEEKKNLNRHCRAAHLTMFRSINVRAFVLFWALVKLEEACVHLPPPPPSPPHIACNSTSGACCRCTRKKKSSTSYTTEHARARIRDSHLSWSSNFFFFFFSLRECLLDGHRLRAPRAPGSLM